MPRFVISAHLLRTARVSCRGREQMKVLDLTFAKRTKIWVWGSQFKSAERSENVR